MERSAGNGQKRYLKVTPGNLRQGHLYVRGHYDFFPPDCIGPPRKTARASDRQIEIMLDGLNQVIKTDLPTDSKTRKPRGFLRDRASIRSFYRHHQVKPDDQIALERLGERRYRLSVEPNGKNGSQPTLMLHRKSKNGSLGRERKLVLAPPSPKVLDLFAGCGGMSLGFHREGFRIIGAIEFDPLAARSHALNFYRHANRTDFDGHARARDITKTDPDQLADELGIIPGKLDVIIGGPPCQSYARVGRAKLREVYEHPRAFQLDPRANLYLRYLEYVRYFRPLVVVMENVPDVLNNGGHNIAEEMCETLAGMGYICRYTLLNAAYYGVPQMRERAFLLGYSSALKVDVRFPAPTHWVPLPIGYQGSRDTALKALRKQQNHTLFPEAETSPCSYVEPPSASPHLSPEVTAEEAIGDMPVNFVHLRINLHAGGFKPAFLLNK